MEVKNQAMDQMLVNTVAQAPANQNAKAGKDTDRPDFDSMVQKRSAEKDAPKAEKTKTAKPAKNAQTKETAKAEAPAEEAPVTGEQVALEAAMMMQAMPDGPRMAQIQPELIAAENTVTVQAVLFDASENTNEVLSETQIIPETADAVDAVETVETAPVQEVAAQAAEQPQDVAEAPAEESKAPEAKAAEHDDKAVVETRPEVKRETVERPAEKPVEHRTEQRTQTEDSAPRTENAPHIVKNENVETDEESETDPAQTAAEAPLFDHVDTSVVKVAEASRPIPLEAKDGVEQLGKELGDVLVNNVDANRVEVQLTPENLGKLTIEITRREDGTLSVVLHTESQRAANLLEKGVDGLRQALTASREHDVQVEVRGNEETQQQFLNPDGQNEQNRQQQQQQHNGRRGEQQQNAQDFLQQLRLGLVDVDNKE